MSKYPAKVRCHMLTADIDDGKGCDPNKCAIKIAVKRAIGGHGYVSVDATGISITRRPDRREKAFMTKPLAKWMLSFDHWSKGKGPKPKPIVFTLTFHKTTRIVKRDSDAVNTQRRQRINEGRPDKKYDLRKRIEGLAL